MYAVHVSITPLEMLEHHIERSHRPPNIWNWHLPKALPPRRQMTLRRDTGRRSQHVLREGQRRKVINNQANAGDSQQIGEPTCTYYVARRSSRMTKIVAVCSCLIVLLIECFSYHAHLKSPESNSSYFYSSRACRAYEYRLVSVGTSPLKSLIL